MNVTKIGGKFVKLLYSVVRVREMHHRHKDRTVKTTNTLTKYTEDIPDSGKDLLQILNLLNRIHRTVSECLMTHTIILASVSVSFFCSFQLGRSAHSRMLHNSGNFYTFIACLD